MEGGGLKITVPVAVEDSDCLGYIRKKNLANVLQNPDMEEIIHYRA